MHYLEINCNVLVQVRGIVSAKLGAVAWGVCSSISNQSNWLSRVEDLFKIKTLLVVPHTDYGGMQIMLLVLHGCPVRDGRHIQELQDKNGPGRHRPRKQNSTREFKVVSRNRTNKRLAEPSSMKTTISIFLLDGNESPVLNVGQRWTSTARTRNEEVQLILVHDEIPITPWTEKAPGNIT